MTELVDRLAELTGYRDRDLLDLTLVGALRDMLGPVSVAIYRPVGEPGNLRWTTRARLDRDALVAASDPAWADVDSLPALASEPERCRALFESLVVTVAGPPHRDCFPVSSDREVVGVLEIGGDRALDAAALRLVGGILRIFHNFQALLDYSERDTLTGLLNRKTFDESFLKATAHTVFTAAVDPLAAAMAGRASESRAAAPPVGHWLGLIDIDHFKSVNDNFGHLIGDEVLLLLARLMRSSFRTHDRLYRFGGEEFLVLMRCREPGDAALALERLRVNTERYAFPQVGRITISIGYTAVVAGDTPAGAIERADKAVYYGKDHGRNQVRGHAELVASGELVEDVKANDVELF